MSEDLIKALSNARIIPIATIDESDAINLGEALLTAGIKTIEVTLRTKTALNAIGILKKRYPDLTIGAGTVLGIEDLRSAFNEGASFGFAPGLDPQIVAYSLTKKHPFFPGICTPTELQIAISLGLKTLKVFPIEPIGGAQMLKVMSMPFQHLFIKYIPTGGITPETVKSYLDLPYVVACGAPWIVHPELVRQKEWGKISKLAADAAKLVGTTS